MRRTHSFVIGFFGFCVGSSLLLAGAGVLQHRYLPYALDRVAEVRSDLARQSQAERYWRTPDEIRAVRLADALPLAGLQLVLDPGHIGGRWADVEGRNFRISEDDFWVREGELVLEVAQRVQARLTELGATVTLTREGYEPINPKAPEDYLPRALQEIGPYTGASTAALGAYADSIIRRTNRLAAVTGELAARAVLINETLQPDAVLSLHINAAPWPEGVALSLVESNHLHMLIFGCLSIGELEQPGQRQALLKKLANRSSDTEVRLAKALATSFQAQTGLPPSNYDGKNAVPVEGSDGYVWARNLLLLRQVECPIVLLEPYVANSTDVYPRIQAALIERAAGRFAENDLLLEYVDAVVDGLLNTYGNSLIDSSMK